MVIKIKYTKVIVRLSFTLAIKAMKINKYKLIDNVIIVIVKY